MTNISSNSPPAANPARDPSNPRDPSNRCRLVITLTGDRVGEIARWPATERQALWAAGDIASIILSPGTLDETEFSQAVKPMVAEMQSAGIAVIIAEMSRIAGRVGADGLQFGQDPRAIAQAVEQYSPAFMVGSANVKSRHTALEIGETQPDYLMFGKPGGDIRPEPHPKNLDLGKWWSAMVEIPCIILGGNAVESVVEVAATGAEFVALEAAIFAPNEDATSPAEAVTIIQSANALLDQHAPNFEIDDA